MSAAFSNTLRPAATKSPGALSRLLRAGWIWIATYRVRRAAIARLHELDDHLLRDIGLTRSQIELAVHGLLKRSGQGRM